MLLRPAFAGYRIAVISDFHIAPWRSTAVLERAVTAINSWQPDLVVLVGDYGHSIRGLRPLARKWYRAILPRVVRALAGLRSTDGIFAVLGNHDSDGGSEGVAQALEGAGLAVLRNTSVEIRRVGGTLNLVGVEKVSGESIDARALLGIDSDVTVLASHYPDFITECRQHMSASPLIVLAGHTHGGQIAFPLIGAPITLSHIATRRFPSGFVPNETGTLYVTRGLGEQLPVRVLAPREVTLLELARR